MARTKSKVEKLATRTTPELGEIGVSGLAQFSGIIQADFLKELRGKEGYKKFNEMLLNSPVIGAMLLAIEQAVRSISWTFASDDENDERVQFLEEARADMSHSWNDHIIEALTMLPYGFSLFEECYKRDLRGRVVWRKFAIRGQDTVYKWLFDTAGGLAGFEQQDPNTYRITPIPIEKLLLYRTRVERGNPEGRSILRTSWVSYYFAKHIQQIEAIGIERDLAGLPVVTLPNGADTADTSASDFGKASRMVRNIRNDEQAGIVLPSEEWKLELLSTGGTRQFDTNEIIKRHESRMLMAALAQFLMLGQESVGSFALSKDQTDFFTMSVNATADIIAETFTKYAIPRLLALNGYDVDGVRLEHTPAGDVDITMVADFLQKVGAYITWNEEDEIWLRQVARLPERDIETLRAERELAAQRKEETRQAFLERSNQSDQDKQEKQEKLNADFYAADAPDDDKRRRRERQWERAIQEYFDAAKKRMLKAAKEMKKGI